MRARLEAAAVALLGYAAAALMTAMVLVTCVDVAARYFFDSPVRGAFELNEVLLAALIFAALPLVTLRQEHVTADLFDAVTPPWLVRVQHVLACVLGTVCTAYMALQLWHRAGGLMSSGQVTAQLKMSLGLLTYGMALMGALTAVALALLAFRSPRRNEPQAAA
jgi:TRAP-type C4-dicarboxylate transport system permease small subunit